MKLLTGVHYDPSIAVAKSTASLLALTAFDTANLRLSVTVPSTGIVLVKMRCNLSGATTFPQVLLGVLEGATVRGRQVALAALPGTALATTNVPLFAEFLVTGLSAGTVNWDAAYAVQVLLGSTNIHYGGPNNNSGGNAWGGFTFEVWDPNPWTFTTAGKVDASVRDWVGDTIPTRNVTGVPKVDVFDWLGSGAPANTGDAFARVGAAGAGLTALGDTRIANLDAAVTTRLAPTTAGRTLDVASTGEAGLDFDNVNDTGLAEMAQAAPPKNPTVKQVLMYFWMNWRNRHQTIATEDRLMNDANTVIAKATLSDDGTVAQRNQWVSGP